MKRKIISDFPSVKLEGLKKATYIKSGSFVHF